MSLLGRAGLLGGVDEALAAGDRLGGGFGGGLVLERDLLHAAPLGHLARGRVAVVGLAQFLLGDLERFLMTSAADSTSTPTWRYSGVTNWPCWA